jgi:tetratricopeptide (TPR) repeat protein
VRDKLEAMAVLSLRSELSPEDRQQKQRLILRDSVALLSLFAITNVLFFITFLLFHSFSVRRESLANRWLTRGEMAMRAGRPQDAIEALRSAQAYAPADAQLQIKLAQALAAAGRPAEATAYFNTLLESQPGDGMINLQLARLAIQQGDEPLAERRYQAALDGTWEGDGYLRRRQVRLELARYLIGQKRDDQARAQLLIAAGNAPDTANIEIAISTLLESAHDNADALQYFEKALEHSPVQLAALEGASRAAFAMGRFQLARGFLERTLNHPDLENKPEAEQVLYRKMMTDSARILALYPGDNLSVRERAQRILNNKKIAQKRFAACLADKSKNHSSLQPLISDWQQIPSAATLIQLEQNPELEQRIMQLVYKTEQVTSEQCGPPTGDDALLLKIAAAPEAVEGP